MSNIKGMVLVAGMIGVEEDKVERELLGVDVVDGSVARVASKECEDMD